MYAIERPSVETAGWSSKVAGLRQLNRPGAVDRDREQVALASKTIASEAAGLLTASGAPLTYDESDNDNEQTARNALVHRRTIITPSRLATILREVDVSSSAPQDR